MAFSGMDNPIKTVEIWRNQILALEQSREERTYPHPACFIEFLVDGVKNYADGIQDYQVRVVFHFAFENYIHDHLNALVFTSQFHRRMHRLTSRAAAPYFSSLEEVPLDLDEAATNVDHPTRTYRTCLRVTDAYYEKTEHLATDIDIEYEIDSDS